ncbi:MAG: NADH-quinone oxidoreductase subunit NuoK [Deltaproteobacteria bacterium]|nr:NADH-quinone oxidoreductase subunit NuoK [Deltaproteobacteria bacterium]MBW2070927.1 NADH-quinone oxidoreductase subunit NuoK [Deltaproteobacteria bacterium]
MPYSLASYLTVSSLLFCLGMYTVLTRRNAIAILMGIELVLNAAALNFVAFSRFLQAVEKSAQLSGQVFTLFIIAVAAAEVAVALAIVLSLYSKMKTIDVEEFRQLHG